MSTTQRIYFASDQHFGAPTPESSFPREQKFVAWLDEIKHDADILFLQPPEQPLGKGIGKHLFHPFS